MNLCSIFHESKSKYPVLYPGALPEAEPGDPRGPQPDRQGHLREQRPFLHILPHHQPPR
jgi:hypothetical protein